MPAPPKVFVSYSRADRNALEQLMPFLEPLARAGLLQTWADTLLEGGADWEREIHAALTGATVAVLLISQNFLASSFVAEIELPLLLERQAQGTLRLLPVFLAPSSVDLPGHKFRDPQSGAEKAVSLARFQGYGTPQRPLSSMSRTNRLATYAELARQLAKLTGHADPPSTSAPTQPSLKGPTGAKQATECKSNWFIKDPGGMDDPEER